MLKQGHYALVAVAEVKELRPILQAEDLAVQRPVRQIRRARPGESTGHVRGADGRPAAAALDRLSQRQDFVSPDDYLFCNALGRPLDGSALRPATSVPATLPVCARCAGMMCATPSGRCSWPAASTS